MKKNIKYEKLSHEIKKEIEIYHNKRIKKQDNVTVEDAMIDWFNNNFEKWISRKYVKDKKSEKRDYFRLDVEIPVRIIETLIESTSDESSAIEFVGTIINISRGGLYFKSNKHIEVSSIILVKIDLSSIDPVLNEIEALAMVMRSEKINNKDYGVGLMFSSIYDEHKESLDLFIFQNVAYHFHPTSRKS